MKYRRGFKTLANNHAREYRRILDVPPHGPLCPWKLAHELGLAVFELSTFISSSSPANFFLSTKGLWEFSGGTFMLPGTDKRLIVLNDGHERDRQASDLSHELSHLILGHEAGIPLNGCGLRKYDEANEGEANWLGPALLVSEEAALHIARRGISVEKAAAEYRVTPEVMQFRLNVTGAIKRIRAA